MSAKVISRLVIVTVLLISVGAFARGKSVNVIMNTNYGDVEIVLFKDKAPATVKNFLKYVDSGFYKKTIFHRVINGFMVQGGGYNTSMQRKTTMQPVKNEASNGLSNEVGTIAMARTSEINSATSQFFINVNNNSFLNYKNSTNSGYGYAVFGKVIKGMSVINKIKMVKTKGIGPHANMPIDFVIINNVVRK